MRKNTFKIEQMNSLRLLGYHPPLSQLKITNLDGAHAQLTGI